jgi:hypothetical protein
VVPFRDTQKAISSLSASIHKVVGMTKGRWLLILAGAAALLLALLASPFLRPRVTPAGQPPLAELTPAGLADLRDRFNAFTEGERVLVMLSPT